MAYNEQTLLTGGRNQKEKLVREGQDPGAFSLRNPFVLAVLLAVLILVAFQVVSFFTLRNRLADIDVEIEDLREQANVLRQQAEDNRERMTVTTQLLVAAGERQEEMLQKLNIILESDIAKVKEAELNLERWQIRWIKFHLAQLECEPSEEVALLFDARTRGAISCWQKSQDAAETGFLNRESVGLLLRGPVSFRDCDDHCPEMALIPPGRFLMGSEPSEEDTKVNEKPRHAVEIAYLFAVGAYEVTLAEWEACVEEGGCSSIPLDSHDGSTDGKRPVTHVTWHEAKAYTDWLSGRTGMDYRLPSESEWEYAARANTTTPFHTGQSITSEQANFDGRYDWHHGRALTADIYRGRTLEAGSLEANAFGLHDVHGNASEWTLDCYNSHYHGAPEDGRARDAGNCVRRVVRGGSWKDKPLDIRSARRRANGPDERSSRVGFRVMRTFEK